VLNGLRLLTWPYNNQVVYRCRISCFSSVALVLLCHGKVYLFLLSLLLLSLDETSIRSLLPSRLPSPLSSARLGKALMPPMPSFAFAMIATSNCRVQDHHSPLCLPPQWMWPRIDHQRHLLSLDLRSRWLYSMGPTPSFLGQFCFSEETSCTELADCKVLISSNWIPLWSTCIDGIL